MDSVKSLDSDDRDMKNRMLMRKKKMRDMKIDLVWGTCQTLFNQSGKSYITLLPKITKMTIEVRH